MVQGNIKLHCIFEVSHPVNHPEKPIIKFVDDYGEDFDMCEDMCRSMNNFRRPGDRVQYLHRCLEQEQFDHKEGYDPILRKIIVSIYK